MVGERRERKLVWGKFAESDAHAIERRAPQIPKQQHSGVQGVLLPVGQRQIQTRKFDPSCGKQHFWGYRQPTHNPPKFKGTSVLYKPIKAAAERKSRASGISNFSEDIVGKALTAHLAGAFFRLNPTTGSSETEGVEKVTEKVGSENTGPEEILSLEVHAVFLDWAKAFDRVPHQRLLSKLQHHGVDGEVLRWLKNFLVGRSQFVRFGGARSEPCEVTSGVIQGSVLGPLLFNIYVSDLPAALKTNLVQYADDCTVFKVVSCQDDVDELQDDLALVDIWCTNNGMQLNAKKCVAMDISRARQPWTPQYTIGGVALDYVCTQRLLGVHISRDLRWNHHVDVQRKKAARTLGFAARNLRGCTQRVKRMAYLTLVKPKLFYGTPAWHPWTKANIGKMARTQNKALHFIYGRHVPPPQNMKMLSVPAQLVYNDLLLFKKSLCGITDYNAMARIIVGRVHRGDDLQHPRLQQPPARTELGQCVFDYRVVAFWNAAPPALKDCSAAQFPSKCPFRLCPPGSIVAPPQCKMLR
ncbi:Hypothetical predicted protein [Cloeon dipterum]|uniref:Reverse transcriptase domain-containing protein n=1 Tax=Cloeon dipterum TaxID=197152 RepID=A0A8S1E280_9INSE|nr:Hypothetical predicted protein [Cloeon dipterum]